MNKKTLSSTLVKSPLGPILVIADEEALYLLEFKGRRDLDWEIERLKQKTAGSIISGRTKPMDLIEEELELYFQGNLSSFKTSLATLGSPFQNHVWQKLVQIPYGETRSYSDIAVAIGKPSAYRAVAQANGANQIAIIIPCHRVINANGQLGGYGCGLPCKQWLLNHEKKYS